MSQYTIASISACETFLDKQLLKIADEVTQFVLFKNVVYYKLRDKTVVQILVIDIGTCFALSYNVFLADLNIVTFFLSSYALEKTVTIT